MTNPSPTVSGRALTFVPALVTLLVVVAASPFADILVSQWPIRMDEVQWRFQVFGLIYAAGPQAALMIALIGVTGTVGAYRLAIRGAAFAALALAVVFIILLFPFGLDFLTQLHTVAQGQKKIFEMATLKTLVFAIMLLPCLVWAGLQGLRVSGKPKVAGRHSRTKGEGLIVAQDGDE